MSHGRAGCSYEALSVFEFQDSPVLASLRLEQLAAVWMASLLPLFGVSGQDSTLDFVANWAS